MTPGHGLRSPRLDGGRTHSFLLKLRSGTALLDLGKLIICWLVQAGVLSEDYKSE